MQSVETENSFLLSSQPPHLIAFDAKIRIIGILNYSHGPWQADSERGYKPRGLLRYNLGWWRAQRLPAALLQWSESLLRWQTSPDILTCNVYENKNESLHLLILFFFPTVINLETVPKTVPSLWKIIGCHTDGQEKMPAFNRIKGDNGEEKDQYTTLSVQLDSSSSWS